MGIYFIAAGISSKNRDKSLDHGFKLNQLKEYISDENFIKLSSFYTPDEDIYVWGANEGVTYNQLKQVKKGEFVVDVKNKKIVQILSYCFAMLTNDTRLQSYIGWDSEKPKEERRPYTYVFFLKNPMKTKRTDKAYFQSAFGFQGNSQWLVGQRYFDNTAVKQALERKKLSGVAELLGINNSDIEADLIDVIEIAENIETPNLIASSPKASMIEHESPQWLHSLLDRLSVLRHEKYHPERDHEDLVASLFEALGYQRTIDIKFQQGYIDILITNGKTPCITVEVKADWSLSARNMDYINQAYNYANKHGTRYVIVTNGDVYVLFDRDKGRSYNDNLIGEFQVTKLTREGNAVLEMLRKNTLIC